MAFIRNSNDENFGTLTEGVTVSQYRLVWDSGGTGEHTTAWIDLDNPRTYASGDPIELPTGDLSLEIAAGDLANSDARDMWDTYLAQKGTDPTAQLGHGGSEISAGGYAEQTVEVAAANT